MSFKPQCAFHKHSEIAGDEELNMRKIVKKWPSSFVRILREKGVISPFGSYICITCITHIENTAEYSSLKGGHPYVGTVINDIDEGNLDPDDLHNIARALGRSQKNTVYCEAKSTSETYSNNLGDLDIQQLITNRNAVLVNFLLEITGLYGSSVENQRARFMPFICALDCILAAAYDRTVTPLLFLVSVLHYFVTGSKTVVNILSCLTPSGHYTILRKWFENYFSNKCLCPSGRDIISFFDNSQVLARNWRVRFNSKAMVSVITTLIHISPSVRTRLQYIPELDPSSWLYNAKLSIEQIVVLMFSLIENCNRVYDTYRDRFIKSTMDKVTHQQVLGSDLIDNHIEHPNLDIAPDNYIKDPYVFVPSTLETGSPSVSLGEPCMKNPCSYESVRSVMDHLLDVTKVGTERQWTTIGCDGLPYILASRIIEKEPKYQHFLLEAGPGHYEINMVRTLFKLLWEVILKDLGYMLGFRSIKAQTSCQKACDHHKSWQMLSIFLEGTAAELLIPYVRQSNMEGKAPSVTGYYQWLSSVKNPNYLFMKNVIFIYVFALFLFRAGIRRNNYEAMAAGRTKFASLFYGLNCTSYQEIEFKELKKIVLSPGPVHEFRAATQSFSCSGDSSRGEGCDFILEAKNKRIQMMMPPGLPTAETWLRICRSLDELCNLRRIFATNVGTADLEESINPSRISLAKETAEWRKLLRSKNYFDNPHQKLPHVSLSSELLDFELVDFHEHSKGNREIYMESLAMGGEIGKRIKLTPVFITPDDRDNFRSIRNKTKEQIKDLTLRELSQIRAIGLEEQALALETTYRKKIKTATKDVMINFYKSEVLPVLDEAENYIVDSDNDAENEEI